MDSMEELKDRLAQVEEEKREAEDNMIRAAHFGKELLEKNQELEAKLAEKEIKKLKRDLVTAPRPPALQSLRIRNLHPRRESGSNPPSERWSCMDPISDISLSLN